MKRLALWLLLGYALCGCTRTVEVKAETHAELQQETRQRETQAVSSTVQTGPETITTTVEEFEMPQGSPLAGDTAPNRVLTISELADARPTMFPADAQKMPPAAVMVKRTVIVDQRGPVVATTRAVDKEIANTTLAAKVDEKKDLKRTTRYGPAWWVWVSAAVALGLAVWLVWRFSLPGKIVAAVRAL